MQYQKITNKSVTDTILADLHVDYNWDAFLQFQNATFFTL